MSTVQVDPYAYLHVQITAAKQKSHNTLTGISKLYNT